MDLGFQPLPLAVTLTKGADFVSGLVADTAWSSATAIALVFDDPDDDRAPIVWAATVAGTDATWARPAVDVDALIASQVRRVQLTYSDGVTRLVWAKGFARVS